MPREPNALPRTLKQRWQSLVRTRFWKMDIHPNAWIAPTAMIDRTWPRGIHIGKDCVIDHHAVVLTHDMTRGIYFDTHIGEGTRLGVRAIVLPGITIGRNCIVEAGALVNRDVPDSTRVEGNPARPVV